MNFIYDTYSHIGTRRNNQDSYTVCWGRNARYAQTLEVGSHILLWGRIQSRSYRKKIIEGDDINIIERTAYEVSASRMECPNPA